MSFLSFIGNLLHDFYIDIEMTLKFQIGQAVLSYSSKRAKYYVDQLRKNRLTY